MKAVESLRSEQGLGSLEYCHRPRRVSPFAREHSSKGVKTTQADRHQKCVVEIITARSIADVFQRGKKMRGNSNGYLVTLCIW